MSSHKTIASKAPKRLVPQLRFKEFGEEWEKSPIGQYIDIKSGYAFKGEEISEDDSGIPILRGINITEGYVRHNQSIDRFYLGTENKRLNDLILKQGDLVLGMDGSKVGKNVAIISKEDEGALLIQRVARLRPKENASIEFIYLHIHSFKFHRYVDVVNTSSGIPHISIKQIKDFKIAFPSLPEQQKIAQFLTAVDSKLLQLTQKKELLEQYKKGVMQQLFNQQLRFKKDDGSDYPDWEEKRLGEVGETFNGLTGKTKEDFGEGKPYVQYMQIFADSKINLEQCGYVSINKEEKQTRVYRGDVFFTTSSETPIEIGTSSVLLDEIKELYLNSFCFGYRPKSRLQPEFARFLFRSSYFRRKIIPLAQGSTRYNMSKKELLKLKVNLPSKQEQQKIANYLSAIDTKIATVTQQIEATQQFKKGLLQQMFV